MPCFLWTKHCKIWRNSRFGVIETLIKWSIVRVFNRLRFFVFKRFFRENPRSISCIHGKNKKHFFEIIPIFLKTFLDCQKKNERIFLFFFTSRFFFRKLFIFSDNLFFFSTFFFIVRTNRLPLKTLEFHKDTNSFTRNIRMNINFRQENQKSCSKLILLSNYQEFYSIHFCQTSTQKILYFCEFFIVTKFSIESFSF